MGGYPGYAHVCLLSGLDGTFFFGGEGTIPPVHEKCRCFRRSLLDEDGNIVDREAWDRFLLDEGNRRWVRDQLLESSLL